MKNIEIEHEEGIRCDNPNCDFVDETVKLDDLEQWLNKPCPKCGENLTEQDFINAIALRETIKVVNELTEDDIESLSNHPMIKDMLELMGVDKNTEMQMTVETHKDLKLKIEERNKKED